MTPAEIVQMLGATTPELGARIKFLDKVWENSEKKISGRFFYLAFRDSKPTIDELINVAHARIVNFAIPRSRIAEAQLEMIASKNMDAFVRLITEARDLFIKTKTNTGRSGELGEILLYMLLEWMLKAPIVACKMYLKTSLQMPVHGTDGIHLGFEGKNLVMYWGESKMHAKLTSALGEILKSISDQTKSPERYANEVRIIRNNLNLDGLDAKTLTAIKNYFNPYKVENNQYFDCYACFAGFNAGLYSDVAGVEHDKCEAKFREKYESYIDGIFGDVLKAISGDSNLSRFRFSYFLLPFPSVDEARALFQQKLWGKL